VTRRRALVLGGALLLVAAIVIIRRRRAAANAAAAGPNAFAASTGAIVPVPVSLGAYGDNAAATNGVDAVALNNAGLTMLQQLTSALISNASLRNGVPATVAVSPSAAPQPRPSSYVPQPIQIGGKTYLGELTNGGTGETEYFTSRDQAVGGALEWKGPGHYTRLKMPPTVAGGGQDTEWIYAGS
jgi:hypothetical protein